MNYNKKLLHRITMIILIIIIGLVFWYNPVTSIILYKIYSKPIEYLIMRICIEFPIVTLIVAAILVFLIVIYSKVYDEDDFYENDEY